MPLPTWWMAILKLTGPLKIGVTNAQLIFEFKHPIIFNIFQAQEYIALGQRVRAWRLEAQTPDGNWLPVTQRDNHRV